MELSKLRMIQRQHGLDSNCDWRSRAQIVTLSTPRSGDCPSEAHKGTASSPAADPKGARKTAASPRRKQTTPAPSSSSPPYDPSEILGSRESAHSHPPRPASLGGISKIKSKFTRGNTPSPR